jgi:DGQHR domain-containing protein
MPSDVLARTCFVTTRDEDPKKGFQRVLDLERAQQIADYIDTGFGTIPNSIVLSAQPEAELKVVGRGKTLEFTRTQKAFLVLDGQHRVYGFSLAKKTLRVPVVIYNGLSRKDETRLFIDINTKQRPVPNELLLDIKRLADYETDQEQLMSTVFDAFADQQDSPLLGQMSSTTRSAGKISRVTFNAAIKPLLPIFADSEAEGIYVALQSYLRAFLDGARDRKLALTVTNPTVFRAVLMLFPEVARRVKDRFAADYSVENFSEILAPMFSELKGTALSKPGNSHRALYDALLKALRTDFKL